MDQNFHLIEKYFRGELSGEELDLFHDQLQNDPAFEQEFRDMKLVREGAKASARMKALNVLQNVEANLTEKETTKINVSMRRLVSIAASLLVIATVSYFAISDRTGGTMTGDEVFAAYYEPYVNLYSGVRSPADNIELNTLAARAYNAYDIKDFSESANLFSELLIEEKSAANFFYSGIANLESGNLELAKSHFNSVINNYSQLREQSQWYIALTLLSENSTDEAVSNLAALSVSASDKKIKSGSKDILKKLGFSVLANSDTGEIQNQTVLPPDSNDDAPDGADFKERKYQVGTVLNMTDGQDYYFHNESPIYGLKRGDLVEFAIVSGGRSKKPMAIIIDRIE